MNFNATKTSRSPVNYLSSDVYNIFVAEIITEIITELQINIIWPVCPIICWETFGCLEAHSLAPP